MSKLILIRGLPGSGKTTYANQLKMVLRAYGEIVRHFEADMYFCKTGEYVFDRSKIHLAHEWCQDATQEALLYNDVVIVSNTFTTMREMEWYLELYKYNHCDELEVYRCSGEYGSIHGVPEETMKKMKARFVDYPGEILI